MYLYKKLEFDVDPLTKENRFYEGDTSVIYKKDHYLYKVYTKSEPYRRQKLDYLLDHYDDLSAISTPPIEKLQVGDFYGMKMKFLEGIDFYKYVTGDLDVGRLIAVLRLLSSRLKMMNALDIHFSDLHHHNILIQNEIPYYIDLDDASIGKYGSCHISCIARFLHELQDKSYEYEDDLIKYGNLDRESLGIFLLDFIFETHMERKSYDDFQRTILQLSPYIDSALMDVFSKLKNEESSLQSIYTDYLGDYLSTKNEEGIKRYIKERV